MDRSSHSKPTIDALTTKSSIRRFGDLADHYSLLVRSRGLDDLGARLDSEADRLRAQGGPCNGTSDPSSATTISGPSTRNSTRVLRLFRAHHPQGPPDRFRLLARWPTQSGWQALREPEPPGASATLRKRPPQHPYTTIRHVCARITINSHCRFPWENHRCGRHARSRRRLVAMSALSGCDRGADERIAPAVVWAWPRERTERIKGATR